MERRQAIKNILGISVAAAVTPLPALAKLNIEQSDPLKLNAKLFNQALKSEPNLLGFIGLEDNIAPQKLPIEGKLPSDFSGTFYRNGPAIHQRQDQRYLHLFEGDGMIQQFSFSSQGIAHQAKFVNTNKFEQEQKAGKFLFSAPDSKLENTLPVTSPDTINAANTNVLPVNGELWALWEGGSATSLNAETLETKGLVNLGAHSKYGNALKGLAFSAHPKVDPDGTIWNFGSTATGDIVLYHINNKGITQKVNILKTNYHGGMLHDFLVTDKHLLIILPSLKRDRRNHRLFNAVEFDKNLPMRVLVVDKNTLALKREYALNAGFAFHFGNAWEDPQGNIRFDASLYPNVDNLHYLSDIMKGLISEAGHAETTFFTLYANGKTDQQTVSGISEFPRIYDHLTGLKNKMLVTLSSVESDVWSDSVRTINTETGKQDTFVYGKDFLVEEHIIVDKSQHEGKGYLVGTALHIPSQRTCINIFKASHVSDGPICRAWLPQFLPLGFHGNFLHS
ncbi:lignostilbene alpha-beta-dioxygenase [Pseudoalteromonas phenolica]|uniref:Lignostilbene alpha-beta-dioxygenase n=1 Tax=Pseudoalteromonas phenolica TaxID=161398 RepID=A0A4Q7ILT2_9GAMM|nr:carotenoid oxygenase family protein [Pseudoalteromonas phenolica]RZQ52711.1 lignostilbene alpha-beta-dioxygenase [Pseudoalteromonas phenolica]